MAKTILNGKIKMDIKIAFDYLFSRLLKLTTLGFTIIVVFSQ